jgi:tetratricopeptide (TPR) repeat protein
LAYHWREAYDRVKSARYDELAGDAAVAVHAHRDAAAAYKRALASNLERDAADRAALYAKLGNALDGAGSGQRARDALEAALRYYESAGAAEDAARTCLALSGLCFSNGDREEHLRFAQRALELAEIIPMSPVSFAVRVRLAYLRWNIGQI